MKRPGLTLLLALLALASLAACGSDEPAQVNGQAAIRASVLVEPAAGDANWFRDVEVAEGTDAYELLETAVDGQLVAEWYAEFQSHFVQEVLGAAPEGDLFWGVFLWNDATGGWEPLPSGADGYTVEDGDVMGWAIVAYDPDGGNLPEATP